MNQRAFTERFANSQVTREKEFACRVADIPISSDYQSKSRVSLRPRAFVRIHGYTKLTLVRSVSPKDTARERSGYGRRKERKSRDRSFPPGLWHGRHEETVLLEADCQIYFLNVS